MDRGQYGRGVQAAGKGNPLDVSQDPCQRGLEQGSCSEAVVSGTKQLQQLSIHESTSPEYMGPLCLLTPYIPPRALKIVWSLMN